MSNHNHYDTLGVARNASHEEIKHQFRQLSKRHHPDVAGGCTAKFQQLSHAASVLTCRRQRRAYDQTLSSPHGLYNFDYSSGNNSNDNAGRRHHHGPRPTTPLQHFTETLFRPRNLLMGSLAVLTLVQTVRLLQQQRQQDNHNNNDKARFVQAWNNPTTGRWEQPAPWDPVYRQLRPTLEFVPRHVVQTRNVMEGEPNNNKKKNKNLNGGSVR